MSLPQRSSAIVAGSVDFGRLLTFLVVFFPNSILTPSNDGEKQIVRVLITKAGPVYDCSDILEAASNNGSIAR